VYDPNFASIKNLINTKIPIYEIFQKIRAEVLGEIYVTHCRPAMPFGNRKIFLEDLFSSLLSQFKKYHTSGNLKFNNLGIFQRIRILSNFVFYPNKKYPSDFS